MSQPSKRCVVLYSGGLDSTVLLHEMLHEGYECLPLVIHYGQRHKKEQEFAFRNCEDLNLHLTHLVLPISSVLRGSSQTDTIEVPRGHYADASMKVTVVPNRNMILLALACAHAISTETNMIAYAAHAGDHTIYPDCRPEFVERMGLVLAQCYFTPVFLTTPFLHIKKSDIVLRGAKLKVNFSKTWSCYAGDTTHCGECGTCVERKEAFAIAGVPDPTEYKS